MNNSKINKDINSIALKQLDWSSIQSEMKSKLGSEIYESWLKKISLVEEFSNYLLLSVPTRFIRDWITSRYLDQILQTVKKFKKEVIRIEFKIVEQKNIPILKTLIFNIIELIQIKDLKILLQVQVINLRMRHP